MVGALDLAGETPNRLSAQARAAMPADVVEGADAVFRVAQNEDALSAELDHEVVAGLLQLLDTPRVKPEIEVDALELALEVSRIGVVPGAQCP